MTINIEKEAKRLLEQDALRVLGREEGSYGHTVLPKNRFLTKLLRFENDTEAKIANRLSDSSTIKTRTDKTGKVLYSSSKSYLLERQISEQILRLVSTFSPDKDAEKLTKADMRLGRGVTPSDEQLSAVNQVINNGVSVITGGPGTGKTTMVLGLVRALKSLKLSITLCAPTGKAAKRLGEATGLQKFNPSTIHMHLMDAVKKNAMRYDVMIVDEASMVDASLLHNLLATIPDGARLVLIGDKDQLPPVASGQPFKDIINLVETHKQLPFEQVRIKPEEGVSGIVSAAYDVITGNVPDPKLNLADHNFEFIECKKEDIGDLVLDYYFEQMPKALNKSFEDVQEDIQILSPQRKGSAGITFLNIEIQNRLTANGTPLFEGKSDKAFFAKDRVMQTSNNYQLGIMNGEVGRIVSKNEEGITVSIDGKDRVYEEDETEDLDLAYAISIHKSQGSEYAAVIIPISSEHSFMLNRQLIYTAITRGKTKVCLIGEQDVLKRTLRNGFKGSRYTALGIELANDELADKISLNRLTEVYRQKRTT
jgi:exodeoxyribonuclease V alpha subunit